MSQIEKKKNEPTEEELQKAFPYRPILRHEEMDLILEVVIDNVARGLISLKFCKEAGSTPHRRGVVDSITRQFNFALYLCDVFNGGSVKREPPRGAYNNVTDGR